MLWTTVIAPLVRHGLTICAGALVTAGYIDGTQSATIVGGLLAVAGVGWSVIEKRMGWAKP